MGHFVLFADDTNIFIVGKTKEEAYKNANIVLSDVYKYMFSNQLHINFSKCTYMHFRPQHNNVERLTCARTRAYGKEPSLRILNHKLKKVDKVKFLGVIIDDKLSWEPQVNHVLTKLNSSIIMIKRIKKFIPESEYMKIYNALFKSHISYCISCWGGISCYKVQKLFAVQKRCIRLLFGKEFSFDHAGFYETCARARTYEEHMAAKNFCLEHTKPLFNENKILTLHNLHVLHTFTDLFKIMKSHIPISIHKLLNPSPRDTNFLLCLPKINLNTSKENFVFSASILWNGLISLLLCKCGPNENGIVVPGSTKNSDMSTSISIIKTKLKTFLMEVQCCGDGADWVPSNSYSPLHHRMY